jgi:hypothetical protein
VSIPGLSLVKLLGGQTMDVYLNNVAYWKNTRSRRREKEPESEVVDTSNSPPAAATFPPALSCIQECDHVWEGDADFAVWFPRPFVG